MATRRGARFWLHAVAAACVVAGMVTALGAKSPHKPEPYALLAGTVWSPAGQPVPGVTVKIRRVDDTKARWEMITNSRGEFIQRLPAGTADYVVWVEQKGHKGPVVQRDLHFSGDERQDIGLHLP